MLLLIAAVMLLVASMFVRRPLAETIATASSPEPIFWIRDIACILIASALSCIALETWNDGMANVTFMYACHEFVVIFTSMVVAYLVMFRGGTAMALVSLAYAVMGMAQHYVSEFRGTPITPTDLSMNTLSTAGEVAVGYDLAPDAVILRALALGIAAMAFSLLIRRPRGDGYLLHVRNMAREIRLAFSPDGRASSDDVTRAEQADEGSIPMAEPSAPEPSDIAMRHQEQPTGMNPDDEMVLLADDSPQAISDESLVTISETNEDPSPFGLIVPEDNGTQVGIAHASNHADRSRKRRSDSEARKHQKRPKHLRADSGKRGEPSLRRFRAVASPIVSLIVTFATIMEMATLWSFDYREHFPDMTTDWWRIGTSYKVQGTLPTFALMCQTSSIKPPAEWTEEKAEKELRELVKSYDREAPGVATNMEMPDVIGIMNESYCDMSIYDKLNLPMEATPQFLRSDAIEGIVDSGRMRVSILGGLTPDSEFEFLTGASMLDFGLSVVPFASYSFTNAPSIVRQLSDLGYGTYAIHPCDKRNWNRKQCYDELGFDEFIDIDDFHETGLDEQFHGAVSDTMCYEMANRILTSREESGEPTFIWNVTMQNHGGYDQGNIPEDQVVPYDLGMLTDSVASDLREYMSCVENSTRSTLAFLERLEDRPRPTMVVFYGDHQPGVSTNMADELLADADFASSIDLKFQTCYFIWENKALRSQRATESDATKEESAEAADDSNDMLANEVTIRPRNDMSVNMFGAIMMERLGCQLTDFQKALIAMRKESPSMSLMGMLDPETLSWIPMDENNTPEPLRKLKDIDWLAVDSKIV